MNTRKVLVLGIDRMDPRFTKYLLEIRESCQRLQNM